MAVEAETGGRPGADAAALGALALAAAELYTGGHEALTGLAQATAAATGAEIVVVRAVESETASVVARAVAASAALAAELEGSRFPLDEFPAEELDALEALPAALRRSVERSGAAEVLLVPLRTNGLPVGTLELLRRGAPFRAGERALGRLAASHALAVLAGRVRNGRVLEAEDALHLAADALAAGSDEGRIAEQVAALAARGSGASEAVLWRLEQGRPSLLASVGRRGEPQEQERLAAALALPPASPAELAPVGARRALTLQLGRPPVGALQLLFDPGAEPSAAVLRTLSTFAARAAHALRSGARARQQTVELERSRALLAVVGQAIAQLSLAHTLETAIERVAELLEADRVAVYLLEEEGGRLFAAAGRGLAGPHTRLAERLLELALGPTSDRSPLVVEDAARDLRLAAVREAVSESGIQAALAVPLVVAEEVIGLLAAYPARGRSLSEDESVLLASLAVQLAVAVQNAQLHEQAKRGEAERQAALEAEQHSARTLRALFEVSRSFAQSLSLEATLEAVVRTVVELLDLDAAAIRMPDAKGEVLLTRALHVPDQRLADPVRAILARPQPADDTVRRPFRSGEPLVLDPASARALGGSYPLLVPFLEKGSTAAILPVSTQAEVLGTLTIISLDPAKPITSDAIELALSVAGHSALALENARLYQQQKHFADSMQRSLLPRSHPELPGFELGEVYASSARMDVGGDVYDFLVLPDGRLAVVLGDVTGHGIDAAADMAMAKFVFRSLAREHPDPGAFLSAANEVVCDEVALSKFITMLYVTVDPASARISCACAGHPWPRLVAADGTVSAIRAGGLALGILPDQDYEELVRELPAGGALVLYTDGVIEARGVDGELYGDERLDAVLAEKASLPAAELARAVVEACRAFAGGELTDDCAVVVIRRA